jgi:hypothetical protein
MNSLERVLKLYSDKILARLNDNSWSYWDFNDLIIAIMALPCEVRCGSTELWRRLINQNISAILDYTITDGACRILRDEEQYELP